MSKYHPSNWKEWKAQVQRVLDEIFRLAKQSSELKIMSHYMFLSGCFENYEFETDEDRDNASWNISVLKDRGEGVDYLAHLITELTGEDPVKPIESFMRGG